MTNRLALHDEAFAIARAHVAWLYRNGEPLADWARALGYSGSLTPDALTAHLAHLWLGTLYKERVA